MATAPNTPRAAGGHATSLHVVSYGQRCGVCRQSLGPAGGSPTAAGGHSVAALWPSACAEPRWISQSRLPQQPHCSALTVAISADSAHLVAW